MRGQGHRIGFEPRPRPLDAVHMRKKNRIGAALASAALGGLVLASPASADCPGAHVASATQGEGALAQAVHCLVNEQRVAAGRRPARVSSQLGTAALRHASEMVGQGYFAHTSPTGVKFVDRFLDTGYTRRARDWLAGENLVWGSQELSSPAALVQAWMLSPPHRDNLLRRKFREVGIAVVRGTPVDAADRGGVTVASVYGYRSHRRKGAKRH